MQKNGNIVLFVDNFMKTITFDRTIRKKRIYLIHNNITI